MTDRARGEARMEKSVEDREHAKDGERDADVGDNVTCVDHFRKDNDVILR